MEQYIVFKQVGKEAVMFGVEEITLSMVQNLIGGWVGTIPTFEDAECLGDEEALLKNLPINIVNGDWVIRGAIVVCDSKGENWVGFDEETAHKIIRHLNSLSK